MTYLNKTPPWFVFLMHARSVEDLLQVGSTRFLRQYSKNDEELVEKVRSAPPLVVGSVNFGFLPIRGEIVATSRLPEAMRAEDALAAVKECANVAVSRGAKLIGLGAYTSIATRGGALLADAVPSNVTVTNGNSYTAALLRQNVEEATEFLDLGTDATVAIVGSTGSVGSALSNLLHEDGYRLVLIGRDTQRVQSVLKDKHSHVMSVSLADVESANIVVLLTSNPLARVRPEMVCPRTIVIDASVPPNIPKHDYPRFAGIGACACEGGIVRIPGLRCDHDIGLAERDATYGCMAETYLFAREGIRKHSIGQADAELATHLQNVASKYGMRARPLGLPTSPQVLAPDSHWEKKREEVRSL